MKCQRCKTAEISTPRAKLCRVCRELNKSASRERFVAAIWPTAKRKETR